MEGEDHSLGKDEVEVEVEVRLELEIHVDMLEDVHKNWAATVPVNIAERVLLFIYLLLLLFFFFNIAWEKNVSQRKVG